MTPKKDGSKAKAKTSNGTSSESVVGYGVNNNLTPGNPGNKGGRPPSRIRTAARESFADRIHIAEEIADGEDERSADRLSALKLLSDTGGVDKIALTLDEQPEREMTPERIADIWHKIEMIKSIKQLEKMLTAPEALPE